MNATYPQSRHVESEIDGQTPGKRLARYAVALVVLGFTLTTGRLMAEASLGGQKFGFTPVGGRT